MRTSPKRASRQVMGRTESKFAQVAELVDALP
jgi:hypothetical protein